MSGTAVALLTTLKPSNQSSVGGMTCQQTSIVLTDLEL